MPPGIIQGRKGRTMKKIDITVDNRTFIFICNWHNTRSGFAHDCTLFINNSEVTTAHCYYINRTWERWSYQAACIAAIDNLITYRMEALESAFMGTNNYKRMTHKRREAFDRYIHGDNELNMRLSLKNNLKDNIY